MKIWIARDEGSNACKIFPKEPYKVYDSFLKKYHWKLSGMIGGYMYLPPNEFQEVSFENSPVEMEIKKIEKE
jgi:hypothetical protein